MCISARRQKSEETQDTSKSNTYTGNSVIQGNGGKQVLDILNNSVQLEGVSLEPGWPLHRSGEVFQRGVPLDTRQAHQLLVRACGGQVPAVLLASGAPERTARTNQRGFTESCLCSGRCCWLCDLHRATWKSLRWSPGTRRAEDNRHTRSTPAFTQTH